MWLKQLTQLRFGRAVGDVSDKKLLHCSSFNRCKVKTKIPTTEFRLFNFNSLFGPGLHRLTTGSILTTACRSDHFARFYAAMDILFARDVEPGFIAVNFGHRTPQVWSRRLKQCK
jgi:hypothetical protein